MGKIVKKTPKTQYDYEIDWKKLFAVFWVALGSLVVAGFLLVWTFKGIDWTLKSPPPPPKVITKKVYISALDAAQKEFIKQCEQNHKTVPNSSYDDFGVPNVAITPWTCTYVKEP